MKSKGISCKEGIEYNNTMQKGTSRECEKRLHGKTGLVSCKCVTSQQDILEQAKNLGIAVKGMKMKRKAQLEEERELLKLSEDLVKNIQFEIRQIQPISEYHLQQLEKRSIQRDLVMFMLATVTTILVEWLIHAFF